MIEELTDNLGNKKRIEIHLFKTKMNWSEAVQVCDELNDGWKITSIGELEIIYQYLFLKNKGNLEKSIYWSNGDLQDTKYAWAYDFNDKSINAVPRKNKNLVIAIRHL
jgi:hypothetical protein